MRMNLRWMLAAAMLVAGVLIPMTAMASVGPESDTNDVYWDDAFSGVGTITRVTALGKDSSGNVYAGSLSTLPGGGTRLRIAQWDGAAWTAVASGADGDIYVLAADNAGNVYAGGAFTTVDGVAASGIAKWDGAAWTPLGDGMDIGGMNGGVYAIAFDNAGNLYAGGTFTTAGGVPANNIAKWDGSAWTPLGDGADAHVRALAADNAGNLYAGGYFTTAGGVTVNCIAKWDGAAWTALGSGMNDVVLALTTDTAGNLYAGGSFPAAGGVSVSYIAKWDGLAWSALGSGMNGTVRTLTADSAGSVYAGGDFTTAGGVTVNRVARWDGSAWSALGEGMNNWVRSFLIDSAGAIFAGGDFTTAGGVAARCIARWDGSAWSACGDGTGYVPGSGLDNICTAVTTDDAGNVYAGGQFATAGGVAARCIAKWDGSAWSPLGDGINGQVYALTTDSAGILYAGFYGGVRKWDGSSWTLLGSGMNGYVLSIALDNAGNVYAGGQFTTAGGVAVNNIAKWDGSAWSPLGSGLTYTTITYVWALATDSAGNLYAGGQFDSAGGAAIRGIAKWDGAAWSQIGSGVNSTVRSIALDRADNLYAAGSFTTAGGVAARYIAKWDGTAWSPLGEGFSSIPYSIALDSAGSVYAGGWFATAGGVTVNRVAKWDGSAWSAFGSGVNYYVSALAVNRDALFVGGPQTAAGGKDSFYFSVWQPRVNQSSASFSETPGAQTLGNDVYGFYKPALTTDASTTLAYAGGLSVDVTLNRADEIQVGGIRINGAFTLGPEDVEFGGSGATLRVEFSEDDAAAFGVAYTEFRAAKLTYPSDYPANKEAATVTSIGMPSAMPEPIRIENGKQIYAITVPLTGIGSTYGAVPQSLIALPAPANPGALIGQDAITWIWDWTDHSNGQADFKVFAEPGAGPPATLQATLAFGAASWRHEGLTPNCRYAFQVAATNGVLDSAKTANLARYTLAGPPSIGNNIACDKTVNTPYGPGATCTFTNPAGFGAATHGGSVYKVSRFRYAWNTSATHVFSGGGSLWSAGTLQPSPAGSGAYYLHLQSLNADGYPSTALDYGPFVFDLDAPAGGVVINDGTGYCNSVNVTLALTYDDGAGSGAPQMQFSNDGAAWSGWEAAASSKAWTLPAGDDTKTVYVQFKDAVGNVSEGISATVILDTIEPVFSNLAVLPAIAAEDEVVTLTFTVSEALLSPPEVTVNGHEAEEAGGKAGSSYAYTYVVQDRYQDPAGPAEIVVSGYDLAGNLGAMSSVNALTIEQQASHVPAVGVLGLAALTALLSWAFIRNATRTKSRAQ